MPLRFLLLLAAATLLLVVVFPPSVPVALLLLALLPLLLSIAVSLSRLGRLDRRDEVVKRSALLLRSHRLGRRLPFHHGCCLFPRSTRTEQRAHEPTQTILVAVERGAAVPFDAALLLDLVPRKFVLQLLEESNERRLRHTFERVGVRATQSRLECVELRFERHREIAVESCHDRLERLAMRLVLLVELLDEIFEELRRS
mmetsp:Transcript_54345/g.125175  ORF Transcript_54345/g.125175 Transcript_54345/m.125175 type:complete len:200 (+) Transcript_54345:350-949(+)